MDKNLLEEIIKELAIPELHDVPGDWFEGPF